MKTERRSLEREPTGPRVPSRCVLATALLVLCGGAPAAAQEEQPVAPSLGLDDVVEIARAQRPDVRAAAARANAAAQRPAIVRRPSDPLVFASVDHLPVRLDGIDYSGGVQVSAPLGRVLHNRRRVAEAEANAQRADVDRVALDVELDASMAFFRLRYARAVGDVFAQQAALLDQLVAATMARYQAGTGAQADVLRAQAERARLEAALRTVAGLREAAEGMLNAAMGRPSGTAIPPLEAPAFGDAPSLEASLRAALEARPELETQRAFITSSVAEIAVMRGMYRPMLMVQAGAAYTMTEGAGLMGMVGVSVPIWRDRLRASVAEARAMRAMNESELEAMQRMIEGEIASAHGDVLVTEARVATLRDEVIPLARQAVDANLAQYAAGRLPLVSPVEASRALFALETELLMAEMERGMARARLGRAMGRSADAW